MFTRGSGGVGRGRKAASFRGGIKLEPQPTLWTLQLKKSSVELYTTL